MSHFKNVCICGKVISQCRCIGDKAVEVIYNCEHGHSTTSNLVMEPITIDSLYAAYEKFMNEYGQPKQLRCDPIFYERLERWAEDYAVELYRETDNPAFLSQGTAITLSRPDASNFKTIFGTPIKVDFTMNPGEWKFEDIHTR